MRSAPEPAIGTDPGTWCIDLAAPLVPAERLLAFPGYHEQFLWAPSPDDELCGVGAAHVLLGSGAARFAEIRDGAGRMYSGLTRLDPEAVGAPGPRLLGGFAFQAGQARSPLWRDFGDARFVLPRIAYARRARRAWHTLSATTLELANPAGG